VTSTITTDLPAHEGEAFWRNAMSDTFVSVDIGEVAGGPFGGPFGGPRTPTRPSCPRLPAMPPSRLHIWCRAGNR
jgi:hypothetical protein